MLRLPLYVCLVALGCLALAPVAQAQDIMFADAHGTRILVDSKNPGRFATPPVPTKVLKAGNLIFNITYNDVVANNNIGFDDPAQGATRQACVDAVLAYINSVLNENSGATIDVIFQVSDTGGTGALASAGTLWFLVVGFNNGFAFEHITTGVDPHGPSVDIDCTVDFGYTWNSDHTVPAGGGQFDLFTVLLHEMTHGLGILSLSDASGNGLNGGNPDTYTEWDRVMQLGASTNCFNGTTTALQVATSAFVSDNLFFNGSNATTAFGSRPPIYAPTTFQSGSSLSHFKTGTVTSVMEHAVSPGETRHEYEPVDIGALQDIGYTAAAGLPGVPPVADFSANATTVTAGATVNFTDLSTNSPTSWAWDFDNSGSTDSTAQNPSHVYNTPGTYTVKLTATNANGSDDEIKNNYITVNPPAPVANFTADITNGTAPLTVNFTDTSTNTPTSWAWDFDNNGSTDSTAQNPSHAYAAPGVYTVKLTATNATGSDDEIKADFITVTTLETTIQVTNGGWVEVGDQVVFTAGPAGALGYQWYKDDVALGSETNQTLVIASATLGDAGEYYCEVTTASKGVANTPTVELIVFGVGALPVGNGLAIAILAAALAFIAMLLVWRSRRTA